MSARSGQAALDAAERLELQMLRADRARACAAEGRLQQRNAELEQQLAYLQAVLANLPEAVLACDGQGRSTLLNPAAEQLPGPALSLQQAPILQAPLLQAPLLQAPLLRALDGEEVHADPMVIAAPGAPARDVLATGRQLRGAHGEVLGAVVSIRDVTDELAADRQAQARAERRTRTLLATITAQQRIAAVAQDRAAVLQQVADAAVEAFGGADGAVVELLHGDTLEYVAAAGSLGSFAGVRMAVPGSLSGVAMSRQQSVLCLDAASDPRVNAEACQRVGVRSMCIAPLFSGQRAVGVLKVSSAEPNAFDVDDVQQLQLLAGSLTSGLRHADDYSRNARLLAESTAALGALEASEDRFRLAFDNSPVGVVLTSLEAEDLGEFLQANQAMAEITGYSCRQLAGMSFRDVHHPADVEATAEVVDRMAAGDLTRTTLETRYRHARGQTLWVRIRAAVVNGDEGRPLYLVCQIEDITAARTAQARLDATAAELAARNVELEAANQLKLDLIGMLGHEIGNPLAAILGYAELATDEWDVLPETARRTTVDVVYRNARRLDTILSEVLALVSLDAGQLTATAQPVEVADRIGAALAQVVRTDELEVFCANGLQALAQASHLEQILVNLLSNAAKYGGGATRISARRCADTVQIDVEDRGPGVSAAFRANLFQRFARAEDTAGRIKGTGLGLYIVRELARANSGDVSYSAGAAGGSVFTLTLPAAPAQHR